MKQALLFSILISLFAALPAQTNTSYQFTSEQNIFTENRGQVVDQQGQPVPDVLAKASMPGLDMYLTKTGVTYILLQYAEDLTAKPHPVYINDKKYKITYSRVDVALTGAVLNNEQMQFTGEAGWKTNYYKTADAKGQLAVAHFKNLTIQNVYPGIDWVWKFNTSGKLEYGFIVHPGANPSTIKMQYTYADLKQTGNNLTISTRICSITEGPLQASSNNAKVQIAYNVNAKAKQVSFTATGYDKTKDLLIDPPLALNWSAQFGGSFLNGLRGVTTDNSGGVYLAGYTTSSDFPTYNPGGGVYYDSTYNGQSDVILLKLDTNQNLLWATFMGGPGNDFANSICYVPDVNAICVTGGAESGFPTYNLGSANHGGQDMFATGFNSNLTLQYSSFYGGSGTDEGLKIFGKGTSCYIVGYTNSMNNSFASIQYNWGYYQTSITGQEAFIMAFDIYNSSFSAFYNRWSTKYGGSGDDYATCVTTDSLENIIVAGFTTSTNLPLLQTDSSYYQSNNGGGYDGFILKFSPTTYLLSASYYGGSGNDYLNDVAVGINGNFVFTGRTNSPNFPLKSSGGFGYNQPHLADTTDDAFIVKTDNDMALKWATYYGGTEADAGTGISTDNTGQIYVSGFTFSTNFPVDSFPGAYWQPTNHGNSDGFIARFTDLGIRSWSTYKGDSCYQYPYDLVYDKTLNKFYVAGEGLLACGQSLPDTGQVQNGVSSVGFCWGFNGQTSPPSLCSSFGLDLSSIEQPCPGQCNGIASVSASGGHAPYDFIWSNGLTLLTDSILCPQEDWVEAKDSLGCFAETELDFSPLRVNLISTAIICNPGPGSITANASGGNGAPNIYQWSTSPGVISDSTTILVSSIGVYTVTAYDALNCSVSASANLGYNNVFPTGQPEVIQYPTCYSYTGGIITLDLMNTDSIFPLGNVVWEDDGYNQLATGDTFYGAGTLAYYYAVDSAYCYNGITSPYYFQVYLDNSTTLAYVTGTNPSTCVSDDGQGSVLYYQQQYYVNGTPPNNYYFVGYMDVDNYPDLYQWSNSETTQIVTDLGIGTYLVTVSDIYCTTVLTGSLSLPDPQVSPVIDSAYCSGGTIDLSNTYGGNGGPYSYQWFDGSSYPYDLNLSSGNYTITVTDYLFCADTVTIFLPQGTPLSGTSVITNPLCFGDSGITVITASGGTPPYIGTGALLEPAGNDLLIVSDQNGCTDSVNLNIIQPSQILIGINYTSTVHCTDTVKVSVTATGGTGPYTGTGSITYTQSGNYTVIIKDSLGCQVDTALYIRSDTCTGIAGITDYTGILVYPNPASDKFYVQFLTALTEPVDIRLFAVDGKLVLIKSLSTGITLAEIDCNQLTSGIYILRTIVLNKEYNFKVVVTR